MGVGRVSEAWRGPTPSSVGKEDASKVPEALRERRGGGESVRGLRQKEEQISTQQFDEIDEKILTNTEFVRTPFAERERSRVRTTSK